MHDDCEESLMFMHYSRILIASLPLALMGCLDCLDNENLSPRNESLPIPVPAPMPLPPGPLRVLVLPPAQLPAVQAQVPVIDPVPPQHDPLYVAPHPGDLFLPPPPTYDIPIAYPAPVCIPVPCDCDTEINETGSTEIDHDETN